MALVWGEGTGGAPLPFPTLPLAMKRTQRKRMGEKMWLFICIQEILVLRKSFFHRRGQISHFNHPRVSSVNRMATLPPGTFRGEKITTKPSLSFDLILMSTLTWITEKELKPEINKRRRPILLKETLEKFLAAVRK